MQQATTARAFLTRLHPWLGKAVHTQWTVHRSFYRNEADAILLALKQHAGRMPPDLALRLEAFLVRLYKEWFPRTWRRDPTYADVVRDFRWWLGVAERWSEPQPRPRRAQKRAPRRAPELQAQQPKRLLRMLSLPQDCTEKRFLAAWRRFLKNNHPDLNPDQSPEERRRFAEAVSLRRR
jgi:hypothetical protein